MDTIRIVIVEDEFIVSEDIKSLLTAHGYEVVAVFEKAEEAEMFILTDPPDLLLVDIRLAGRMNGIQLVEKIKESFSLPVIYITANSESETYIRARATGPNAFLVKPFTAPNLLASIDLALFNFSNEVTPEKIEKPTEVKEEFGALIHTCLFIRSNGRFKKVCAESILFVEAAGSYVHIQTIDDRFTLTQNLGHFLKKNPIQNIIRIHRSYLVNVSRVESFDDSFVFIKDHKLPLSDSYKNDFMTRVHCL